MRNWLAGIRVLDFSQLLGPYCISLLSDLGADVICVERPVAGDPARSLAPDIFWAMSRNKRRAALDLRSPQGQTAARRLIERSDVVVEGFRPGVMDVFGLGYSDVAQFAPSVVYCSISGFGQTSPLRDHPGHDIGYLAMSGLLSLEADASGAPAGFTAPVGDLASGAVAAVAILAALRERDRTPDSKGAFLDIAIADVAASWAAVRTPELHTPDSANEAPRTNTLPGNAVYTASDGERLALAAVEDKFWERLLTALELPELLEDPRLGTQQGRLDHRAEVSRLFADRIGARPARAWLELFGHVGVPATPVLSTGAALTSEQALSRGFVRTVDGAADPAARQVVIPVGSGEPDARAEWVRELGVDTVAALTEAGLDLDQINVCRGGVPVRWKEVHTPAEGRAFRAMGLWSDQTVFEILAALGAENPTAAAVLDGDEIITYAELVRAGQAMAGKLASRGVGPGDVVMAQLPSTAWLPVLHAATSYLGGIFLPLSPSLREAELSAIVATARPQAVIGDDQSAPRLAAVLTGGPAVLSRDVLSVGGGVRRLRPQGQPSPVRGAADAPSLALASSGTTGVPKISLFTSNDLRAHAMQFRQTSGIGGTDVMCQLAPGQGGAGYNFGIILPLLVGSTTALLAHWSPAAGVARLRGTSATMAMAIPTQLIQMLAEPAMLPQLRVMCTAGALLPPHVGMEVEGRFGARIWIAYGSSDGGVATMTPPDADQAARISTVGKPCAGTDLRILDPLTGDDVAGGEVGEVAWRSANKSMGYLDRADLDRKAWRTDRWYRSGDLGSVRDGYLRISGRATDMIIRGGMNVYPSELEALIADHPRVREVAVVGVADSLLGQRACAVVGPVDPATPPSIAEIGDHLEHYHQVARWKRPEILLIVTEIPRSSASAKVDRQAVHALVMASQNDWQYAQRPTQLSEEGA